MKHLKKFNSFSESAVAAEPATKPATKPAEPTTKPETRPDTNPGRPSPIRRDRPAVEPDPMAKKGKLKKATAGDVANRYLHLSKKQKS